MAIADRINEMYTHVGDVYDTITNVDLPTNKNIQNIPQTIKDSYLEIMNNGIDTIWNNWEKVTGEGTSLTLNNTEQAPMKNELKGNTYQTQYSGKNLLPPTIATETKNGITLTNNGDGSYTLTGSYSGSITAFSIALPTTLNGTYSFSGNNPVASSNIQFRILKSSGSPWSTYLNNVNRTYENQTIENGTEQEIRIVGPFTSGFTLKPQLESGSTATSYEPYVGGVAIPNPNSPQDVNVVSGDNEIVVNGKNFFDKSKVVTGYLIENGTIYDTLNYNTSDYIIVEPNTSYYKTLTQSPRTKYYDSNKQPLNTTTYQDVSIGGNPGTFTTPDNAYYLRFSYPISGTTAVDVNTTMIHKGTTVTNYEPYQGNTYNIDLPEGMELCKIGNYQDYFYKDSDKWYLHKEIGKVVLNGSETWALNSNQALYVHLGIDLGINLTIPDILSNYYEKRQFQKIYDETYDYGISFGASNADRFCIRNKDITSVNDFKAWLSTHNTIVCYPLATPTNTEITYQPLIDQLNELEKAISYENQTNISQVNNDLPFIISASALKKDDVTSNNNVSLLMSVEESPNMNVEEEIDEEPVEEIDEEPVEEIETQEEEE